MLTHRISIEYEKTFQTSKRWVVLCDCGFRRTGSGQLAAEEIAASHKNQMGDTENARLIDAAPELFEALMAMLKDHNSRGCLCDLCGNAAKALAKARGLDANANV